MRNVLSARLDQNPARQAGLKGGLHPRLGSDTTIKVCRAGSKAVALAVGA